MQRSAAAASTAASTLAPAPPQPESTPITGPESMSRLSPTQGPGGRRRADLWITARPVDEAASRFRLLVILNRVGKAAAFFDLDKTIIAKSSTLAFGRS